MTLRTDRADYTFTGAGVSLSGRTVTIPGATGGSGGLPWIDVTKAPYNAVSDPTGGINNYAGIKLALEAARDAGGGVVYFPKGTYYTWNDGTWVKPAVTDQFYFALHRVYDRTFIVGDGEELSIVDSSKAVHPDQNPDTNLGMCCFFAAGTVGAELGLTVSAFKNRGYIDVDPSVQPNTVLNDYATTPGQTNTFLFGDAALVGSQFIHDPTGNDSRLGEIALVDVPPTTRIDEPGVGVGISATPVFQTTLATGLASGGSETTVDLVSAAGLAGVNPLQLWIQDEVISWTGITGNQLTGVTRGVCGTSKPAHAVGATVMRGRISVGLNQLERFVDPQGLAVERARIEADATNPAENIKFTDVTIGQGYIENVKRGDGTAISAHVGGAQITNLPPAGRIFLRSPLVDGPYNVQGWEQSNISTPHPTGNSVVTCTVGLAVGTTAGEEIYVSDADLLPANGTVLIDSEYINYTYRTGYVLKGTRRGARGSTIATHSVGAAVVAQSADAELTLTVNSSLTSLEVKNAEDLEKFGYVKVDNEIIGYAGTTVRTTTLSAGVSATDTTIPLTSVTGFHAAPGQITLGGSEVVSYAGIAGNSLTGCERGWGGSVAKAWASGAGVKQRWKLASSVKRGQRGSTAAAHTAGAVVFGYAAAAVQKLGMLRGIGLRSLGMRGQRTFTSRSYQDGNNVADSGTGPFAPLGSRGLGARFEQVLDPIIFNCKFESYENTSLTLTNALGGRVHNIVSDGHNKMGLGYGVRLVGACQDIIVSDSIFRRGRHAQTTDKNQTVPGIPRRVLWVNCLSQENLMGGYTNHPQGQDQFYVNCEVVDSGQGFQMWGNSFKLIGCICRRTPNTGITVDIGNTEPLDILIHGCTVEDADDLGIRINIFGAAGSTEGEGSLTRGVVISNNTVSNCVDGIIVTQNSPHPFRYRGVRVLNNSVYKATDLAYDLQMIEAGVIQGNIAIDCSDTKTGMLLTNVSDSIISANALGHRRRNTGDGIQLVDCDGNIVTANRVPRGDVGVLLDDASTDNLVINNHLRGCNTGVTLGVGAGNSAAPAGGNLT